LWRGEGVRVPDPFSLPFLFLSLLDVGGFGVAEGADEADGRIDVAGVELAVDHFLFCGPD
jgi:hypothetical protein